MRRLLQLSSPTTSPHAISWIVIAGWHCGTPVAVDGVAKTELSMRPEALVNWKNSSISWVHVGTRSPLDVTPVLAYALIQVIQILCQI